MGLKYKIKSVIVVDYNDLDEFLTERFNLPKKYEFVAIEELGNDIIKSINVSKSKLSEYDQKYVDAVVRDKNPETYSTGILLCHLCNLEEIPEGEYLINVS